MDPPQPKRCDTRHTLSDRYLIMKKIPDPTYCVGPPSSVASHREHLVRSAAPWAQVIKGWIVKC